MATQVTSKLVIVDGMPSVEKLWNGRFSLEFFCQPSDKVEGWYKGNIDKWLPAFGSLQDAAIENGWTYPKNSDVAYDDMCLVEASVPYVPSANEHFVKLSYETLTAAWVLEKDEDTDYELNGLKRVTRTFVALPDTAYTEVVGTSTITSDGTVLYLGNYKIVETDAKWTLQEIWLEAGTLSISKSSESDGVMSVTTVFFGVKGATVGPVIAEKTDDYEGLPTFSVTTLQDVDGNSIVDGGENLVNQVSGVSPFTYPGVLEVNYIEGGVTGTNTLNIQALLTKAPAQSKVKTTTYFIFQSSNSIADSDYTYASSSGLWSPNHWAAISAKGEGTFSGGEWNDSSTFRGYRTSSSGKTDTIDGPLLTFAVLRWQGNSVLSDETKITYTSTVDQGPPSPIGNTYTLDVQITPAFDDVDGNQYYKKAITVTDTIPTQPTTASLPYT